MAPVCDVLDVPALPTAKLPVTAWRAAKGEQWTLGNTKRFVKRARYARAAREAADLAGVPVRTLHGWTTAELVEPTFTWNEVGMTLPRYAAGDVFAARLCADLKHGGFPRLVIERAVHDAVETWGGYWLDAVNIEPSSFDDIARDTGGRLFVPCDKVTSDVVAEEHAGFLTAKSFNSQDPWEAPTGRPVSFVEYPLNDRLRRLAERAAAWWRKAGGKAAPWMA